MKRYNLNLTFWLTGLIFLILGTSSCGIITRTRYGNGLKLNSEYGPKAMPLDSSYIKGVAARKAKREKMKQEQRKPELQTTLPNTKKPKEVEASPYPIESEDQAGQSFQPYTIESNDYPLINTVS